MDDFILPLIFFADHTLNMIMDHYFEAFLPSASAADMGTKLLRLPLHEAKVFKGSASASWFQKVKASAPAS